MQILGVEYALGDQPGEDHQQTVGIGDVAGDERLVDHRQRLVFVFLDRFVGSSVYVAASSPACKRAEPGPYRQLVGEGDGVGRAG